MTDVALAIEALVPAAKYGGTVTNNTADEFDALSWEDQRPKPTWKQVQAATIPAPLDGVDRLDIIAFKVAFNHENRIRALEGKQLVTAAQFRNALRAL